MRYIKVIILFVILVVGLSLLLKSKLHAGSPSRPNDVIILICDEEGDLVDSVTDDMSTVDPDDLVTTAADCQAGSTCGTCMNSLQRDAGCKFQEVVYALSDASITPTDDSVLSITITCQ